MASCTTTTTTALAISLKKRNLKRPGIMAWETSRRPIVVVSPMGQMNSRSDAIGKLPFVLSSRQAIGAVWTLQSALIKQDLPRIPSSTPARKTKKMIQRKRRIRNFPGYKKTQILQNALTLSHYLIKMVLLRTSWAERKSAVRHSRKNLEKIRSMRIST